MAASRSRREFLGALSAGIGGAWLAAGWPAIASAGSYAARTAAAPEAAGLRSLTPGEALEIDAMAARIIPSDDGPGAREAGVVYFFDHAFGTFLQDERARVGAGLAALEATVAQRHPGATSFATLDPAAQDDVLRAIETTDFFEFVRWGTIAGFLANPSYGGNREQVGWKWIGFEDRFVWQPPFGYYDRGGAGGS
jgi:gluconate 2-dehydrogenase gamma chain